MRNAYIYRYILEVQSVANLEKPVHQLISSYVELFHCLYHCNKYKFNSFKKTNEKMT